MAAGQNPLICIIMPALNEERYIESAVRSILPRQETAYELLVMDGASTDRTCEIVRSLSLQNSRIKLADNPGRIQSAAMNLGAAIASPSVQYLVRADCHAEYPPGFAERCVAALEAKNAASVVVAMRSAGRGCIQKAIAAAQNSRLGNGGAAHRVEGKSAYVDHGHHAAFRREDFLAAGGYDEGFTHNEDAELDRRLIMAGRRIYLDGDLTITYYPRANFIPLARQYRNYGWGRAHNLLKHGTTPRLRQLLPVAALLGNAGAFVLAYLDARFLLAPLLYASLCFAWGFALALRQRSPCLLLSGAAAIVMHMSWAAGFLQRLAKGLLWGRARKRASTPGEAVERA